LPASPALAHHLVSPSPVLQHPHHPAALAMHPQHGPYHPQLHTHAPLMHHHPHSHHHPHAQHQNQQQHHRHALHAHALQQAAAKKRRRNQMAVAARAVRAAAAAATAVASGTGASSSSSSAATLAHAGGAAGAPVPLQPRVVAATPVPNFPPQAYMDFVHPAATPIMAGGAGGHSQHAALPTAPLPIFAAATSQQPVHIHLHQPSPPAAMPHPQFYYFHNPVPQYPPANPFLPVPPMHQHQHHALIQHYLQQQQLDQNEILQHHHRQRMQIDEKVGDVGSASSGEAAVKVQHKPHRQAPPPPKRRHTPILPHPTIIAPGDDCNNAAPSRVGCGETAHAVHTGHGHHAVQLPVTPFQSLPAHASAAATRSPGGKSDASMPSAECSLTSRDMKTESAMASCKAPSDAASAPASTASNPQECCSAAEALLNLRADH
jgi:hypothetical protein